MTLAQSIAAFAATASAEVFIAGRRVQPLSGVVELGFDNVSASAEIVLPSLPSWLQFRQELEVWLGWDGQTKPVFKGFVEDHDPSWDESGTEVTIKAAGYLKATQYRHWDGDAWAAETDGFIVEALLDKAGVSERSIHEWGELFGVVEDVVLNDGDDTWDLINRLDQVTGYKTYDGPDGVVRRRRISGNPSGTAARTFTEGVDIFKLSRPRTIRGIHNAVTVTGLEQPVLQPAADRQAENPLVPDPPKYISYEFQSDLIEDNDMCEAVAERLMTEVNRVVEEVPLECKGDPRRQPGETIGIVSPRVGLSSSGKYWCKHVTHAWGPGGYITTLLLEGGIGSAGYETDLDPIAAFTYRLTRETFDVGGVPTEFWTVTADGSASSDPDGFEGVPVLWAWENNKNADVGSALTYSTRFSAAEITTATITLTVTDADANTNALTQNMIATNQNTNVRDLYIAANGQAEATSDGGANWNIWNPASDVISTPPIAGEDHSYFGLANGKLYRTDDYLDTAPVEVHDFGSQVNCIWIHEIDANHVTVGLQNGGVWRTLDAELLGSSTWTLLKTYGNPVLDIVASFAVGGQYRVATGDEIKITYTDFADDSTLIEFAGGTARRIIPSLINLPGKGTATAGTDPVQSEDGTAYTFATAAPSDVRAGTHHIRQEIIYIADSDGKVWATEEGGTEFSEIGLLGSGDPANQMIRDGDNQLILYVAADDAAWKSFDGGVTWGILRDYSAGGLIGNQMGYGGLRALGITALTVVTNTTWKVMDLWNGSGNDSPPTDWNLPAYDDSAWDAAVVQGGGTIGPAVAGSDWITDVSASDHPDTNQLLFRKTFTLSDGIVTTATLTTYVDNYFIGCWVNGNGVFVITTPDSSVITEQVYDVPPEYLIPGGLNVIAFQTSNHIGASPPVNDMAVTASLVMV